MQMTYEQAMRPGGLMWFASRRGSGYMMRSEKRNGGYGSPNRRPPRRKKAGFFYIFFTLLLSVILWPVGMVMLWQRKVRMTAGTKLVVSLLTLCLSVFLIVFALTVPLDNVEFTAFQDKANDWLDKAAADVAVAGDAAMKKTSETWQVMRDFAEASAAYSGAHTADAIDAGVEAAGKARAAIEGLFHREEASPAPSDAPALTEGPEATKAAKATEAPETTNAPKATKAPKATEAPEANTAEAAGATDRPALPVTAATDKPAATEAIGSEAPDGVEIRLPEATPSAADATPLSEGTLHANGEFEPGDMDATTDAPDGNAAAPLAEATAIPLKPATALPTEAVAEAATEGPAQSAADAPEADASDATTQAPEEGAVLWTPVEEATEAPTEEATEAPAAEPAEANAEEATEAPAAEAAEANAEEATEAPAAEPAEANAEEATEAPAAEATEATAAEPTEAVTEAPAAEPTEAPAQNSGANYTVKPAAQATVYFFDNGSVGFHIGPNRHDMSGAPAHTLQEAFDMNKNPCQSCGMPDRNILDEAHVAWVDADNRIHTTDECPSFKGQWRLMALEKAVSAGYAPCEDCGADFYVEEIFPAPTPTPEPEAVSPAVALKPVSEIKVYYYNSSKGYHIGPNCSGMENAPAHSLAEAAASGKKACKHCNPPSAGLLGQAVLWQDADGVCHTSDDCASFSGSYTLILRDDALAKGLAACPDCGATDYLIPGTVLAGY